MPRDPETRGIVMSRRSCVISVDVSSGAIGVVGFILKFGADWWTAARQERRQDGLWRRGRLTDAASELLTACVDARKASGWVVGCVEELGGVERQHNVANERVLAFERRLAEAQEAHRLSAERINRALEPVLPYAKPPSREAASELVRVTKENPSMQEVLSGPFHNQAADNFRAVVMGDTALSSGEN